MSTASGSIRVAVCLHAELARSMPNGSSLLEVTLPGGSTVGDLLRLGGVSRERRLIIGVNHELAAPNMVLSEGDRVDVMTPMAGGSSAGCGCTARTEA